MEWATALSSVGDVRISGSMKHGSKPKLRGSAFLVHNVQWRQLKSVASCGSRKKKLFAQPLPRLEFFDSPTRA